MRTTRPTSMRRSPFVGRFSFRRASAAVGFLVVVSGVGSTAGGRAARVSATESEYSVDQVAPSTLPATALDLAPKSQTDDGSTQPIESFDGTYVGTEIIRSDPGAIIEVLDDS